MDPTPLGCNQECKRACTLGYTPEVLGPYFLENFLETVKKSDVQQGGFQVIVGGDAYGSGSSREVAVVAHRGAGIELVIAMTSSIPAPRWATTATSREDPLP